MARRNIHRQRDLAPRLISRRGDRLDGVVKCRFDAGKGRREPALVRRQRVRAVLPQPQVGRGLVHRVRHRQSVIDRLRGSGNDQHVLDRHLPAAVLAAAEQVDRHARERIRLAACDGGEVLVQGDPARDRVRAGEGEGDGENRVGTEPRFVCSVVEAVERRVDAGLRIKAVPDQRLCDLAVDRRHRPPAPLPAVAIRVAVAKLVRLGRTCRSARRD